MPTTKPSISLSAVSLEAGGPEFGAPDLTELRTVIRPFPKDAAERDCYRYLLEQMQATPDRPLALIASRQQYSKLSTVTRNRHRQVFFGVRLSSHARK